MWEYKKVEKCRACGSKELVMYLDLGRRPLSNALIKPERKDDKEKTFPLEVLYCKNCSLSQLSVVVNPEILFADYVYHSSISETFRKHCEELAAEFTKKLKLGSKDLVVDIASNDGCLLKEFKKSGIKVLGIEPAENLKKEAEQAGIPTEAEFWNAEAAEKITEKHGKASLITAQNVFAHVDDINSFVKGAGTLLKDEGRLVIECPYLADLIKKKEFDTVYHEHLSYFLIKPIKVVLENNGFAIENITKLPIHGGSVRITAKKAGTEGEEAKRFLETERKEGLHSEETYRRFSDEVKQLKEKLVKTLAELKKQGKKIAGYGASAKGAILADYCMIGSMIDYVVDDTPSKQGKLMPGSRIPIVPNSKLKEETPDYLILLAWNFAEELMKKTEWFSKKGGKYIIPLPEVRII